jgi:hypothetical protein
MWTRRSSLRSIPLAVIPVIISIRLTKTTPYTDTARYNQMSSCSPFMEYGVARPTCLSVLASSREVYGVGSAGKPKGLAI